MDLRAVAPDDVDWRNLLSEEVAQRIKTFACSTNQGVEKLASGLSLAEIFSAVVWVMIF